ncbi:MAG: uncharacterized membrane protein YjjP (DUF1212 family) [Polyangiales bacterium]|jgi:uncharacterized membrane protein YjjP (DUF1212 family)
MEPSSSLGRESLEGPRLRFIYDLAGALHAYGTPSHRLEALLGAVADELGVQSEFFATPTAIFCAFGEVPDQKVGLIAPEASDLDLGRMAELDVVAQDVASGDVSVEEGSLRVKRILDERRGHGVPLRMLAHALLAGSTALLLGGGLYEALVALVAGALVGIVEISAQQRSGLARVLLPLGALLASLCGIAAAKVSPALSITVVGIAGIIYLLPGLTLTVAMMELATGHLVSGTARLAKAVAAFMLLGVGALVAGAVAKVVGVQGVDAEALSRPWLFAAMLTTIGPLLVLLNVRGRDAFFVTCAGIAGYGASELARLGGPILAAGVGTFVIGLMGNAWARLRNRPAAVATTPGILLLVPGSVGVRAISAFLSDDVLAAVTLSFQAFLTAVALVSGLLLANMSLPPRKAL